MSIMIEFKFKNYIYDFIFSSNFQNALSTALSEVFDVTSWTALLCLNKEI